MCLGYETVPAILIDYDRNGLPGRAGEDGDVYQSEFLVTNTGKRNLLSGSKQRHRIDGSLENQFR